MTRERPPRATRHGAPRLASVIGWSLIIAVMIAWEAWSLTHDPRSYPSFSSVVDRLWHFHTTSILLFEFWLLLGWDILISRHHRLRWFDRRASPWLRLVVVGGSLVFAALVTLLPPRNVWRWAAFGLPAAIYLLLGLRHRPVSELPIMEWARRSRTYRRALFRHRRRSLDETTLDVSAEGDPK